MKKPASCRSRNLWNLNGIVEDRTRLVDIPVLSGLVSLESVLLSFRKGC